MNQSVLSDASKIKNIQQAIRSADAQWKIRFPVLNHQNALGLSLLLMSFAGMLASGFAYFYELIPAWACIFISAMFAGISHEIEHDLIHRLYFKNNKIVHNFMMLLVWVMRPNTVNPWYRRSIHFNHHKTSGSFEDIEERVIGNGMKFGWLRILIALDGFLSISLRAKELNQMKLFNYFSFVLKGAPLAHIFVIGFYGFLAIHTYEFFAVLFNLPMNYPTEMLSVINILNIVAVVWILPNALRAFCLHNITTSMHYFGDVDSLLKQCQVLNHWSLLPFHLFCFNFGSTHVLHHFVVSQPFYLRQLVAKDVMPALKENGIRFNDFSNVLRGNRYAKETTDQLTGDELPQV